METFVEADFGDLRFTASDGTTLLSYWIELTSGSATNQLATIWINFDTIGTSATTFYMYYGNPTVDDGTSGSDTFLVFDDFERGSNGEAIAGIWNEGSPHVNISTDHAYTGSRCAKFVGASGSAQWVMVDVNAGDISINLKLWKEDAAAGFIFIHGNGTKTPYWYVGGEEYIHWSDTSDHYVYGAITRDAWTSYQVRNFNYSAYTYDIYVDPMSKTGAVMKSGAGYLNKLLLYHNPSGSGRDIYIDNFYVRKYYTTEPAWGKLGYTRTRRSSHHIT